MLLIVAVPVVMLCLYLWATGHPAGIFVGFLPVMACSFAVTFAVMNSEPTPTSSFWAVCAGLVATVLPFILRCIRQEAVAQKQSSCDFGGGNGDPGGWVRLQRLPD